MTASYANIPAELRALPHWCVWRYEDGGAKPTKVPYYTTDKHMRVNDPETWLPFEQAVELSKQFDGIGFVFKAGGGYTFIDLDDTNGDQAALNRQIEIHREMESYSEISPSGRGLHIIVRGNVPSGRRRSSIEIYSSHRYATFTGNVYNNTSIRNCQEQLTQLWEQMGSGPNAHSFTGDEKEKHTDEEIISQARNAANKDKFNALFAGKWNDDYSSQSEADQAIINIIAFYSKNGNQVARIFRSSGLGARTKAHRQDYVSRMILKAFDRELPPIDFDGITNALEDRLAATQANGHKVDVETIIRQPSAAITLPPGFLGEIAQFLYGAAPLPVPEIAIAGAIGLMAGICGRSYNVNDEGLNQYILLVAQSGTGKESMSSGIDKIVNSVKGFRNPTIGRLIGPGEITSGEALIRYINKPNNQCFLSILSEFGHRLQVLSDKRNFAQSTLKRMLLQLYHSSGKGRIFRPKIFSDKDKDIGETHSPAISILAETPPGPFYECVTEEIIADGFLPRFIIIEYKGERVALNSNMAKAPSEWFVNKFSSLFGHCEALNSQSRVVDVQSTAEVVAELDKLQEYARDMINRNAREDIRQLWNRAHIKTWKLAALVAVGCNPYDPIIQKDHFDWAMNIVNNDIRMLSVKFESGEVGSSVDAKQQIDLSRVIKDWLTRDWDQCKMYCQGKNDRQLHHDKILPYAYINKRLSAVASFKNTGRATTALHQAIQVLIDSDKLREIGAIDKSNKYSTTQKCYVISDPKAFNI